MRCLVEAKTWKLQSICLLMQRETIYERAFLGILVVQRLVGRYLQMAAELYNSTGSMTLRHNLSSF